MSTTPNLAIPEMAQNTFQPSVTFNQAMQIIDALLGLAPVDKDLSAPPTTSAINVGNTWIVGASPTGAWNGQAKSIALCTAANQWVFLPPKIGLVAFVQDETKFYVYNGTAWVLFSTAV